MSLRKKECPRQSIRQIIVKKANGKIGAAVGVFSTLFLAVFLCALLQMEAYRATSVYLEDALAASNLASAVIDLKEYGLSHKILIEDPDAAYERYKWAVKGNLNLNDLWEGQGSLVQGLVRIVDYTVYNVNGSEVIISHFDENGLMTQWQESLGGAVAPNGVAIESTSVYSEIVFTVKGFFGTEVQAHKGNLADIAR